MIYIFWSCGSKEEAKKIIYALLEKRLIACGSMLPQVQSIYRWKGSIEESQEIKVILKTGPHHFETIQRYTPSTGKILDILRRRLKI